MAQKIPDLNDVDTKAGFSHFEDGLTPQEHAALAKMQVNTDGQYNNFGVPERLTTDTAAFFEKLGNNPAAAKELARITNKAVERAIAGFGSEAAWVAIRAFTPTNDFDVPRWHVDGRFFKKEKVTQLKAVFNLKGASTLFRPGANEDQREKLHALILENLEDQLNVENRKKREALLKGLEIKTTPAGCGTAFMTHVAVHSEPPMHSERIFVSILPGTKAEIEAMRKSWGAAKKAEFVLGDQKPTMTTNHPKP